MMFQLIHLTNLIYYLSKIIYYNINACLTSFEKEKKRVSLKVSASREKSENIPQYTITQDILHINPAKKIQSFIRKRLTMCSICSIKM